MKKPNSGSQFLRSGLRILSREFPECFSTVSTYLTKIPGYYVVGEERFTVTASEGKISVRKVKNAKKLRVQAELDHCGILSVVDGTSTVQVLLAREQLLLTSDAEALLIMGEVVRLVVESAIRSSTLQRHFEDYRNWVLGLKPSCSVRLRKVRHAIK